MGLELQERSPSKLFFVVEINHFLKMQKLYEPKRSWLAKKIKKIFKEMSINRLRYETNIPSEPFSHQPSFGSNIAVNFSRNKRSNIINLNSWNFFVVLLNKSKTNTFWTVVRCHKCVRIILNEPNKPVQGRITILPKKGCEAKNW